MSTNWSRSVRNWHRWLSVIIGLQLLLWTSSGLVMTWNAIEDVRGDGWITEARPPIPADLTLELPHPKPEGTAELRFLWSRGRWSWHALGGDGETLGVFDGRSGRPLADLEAEEAATLADEIFTGPGAPVTATLVEQVAADDEYRGNPLPAWRVTFDDPEHSSVYLAADTGAKTKVRTDTWRLFDFCWMLHIMDYEARTDFNHPLLQVAAGAGVATSLTGIWLAVLVLRPRKRNVA
jgi:hypothetical protein